MEANEKLDRRRLLKGLAAAGGAVAASALIPARWSKPSVSVGVLPAHAQVTGAPDLVVELCWEEPINLDVTVIEPGGGDPDAVGPNNPTGPTATYHGDDQDGGCELITVPAGGAADGHYHVDLWNWDEQITAEATLTITTPAGTFVCHPTVPPMTEWLCSANVWFPGGTVEWIALACRIEGAGSTRQHKS